MSFGVSVIKQSERHQANQRPPVDLSPEAERPTHWRLMFCSRPKRRRKPRDKQTPQDLKTRFVHPLNKSAVPSICLITSLSILLLFGSSAAFQLASSGRSRNDRLSSSSSLEQISSPEASKPTTNEPSIQAALPRRRRRQERNESLIGDNRQQQHQTYKCHGDETTGATSTGPLEAQYAQLANQLGQYYNLNGTINNQTVVATATGTTGDANDKLLELPRPTNVTVLIISWYPPVLKLSWNLNELEQSDASKLNFYDQLERRKSPDSNISSSSSGSLGGLNGTTANSVAGQFDLDLALDKPRKENVNNNNNNKSIGSNQSDGRGQRMSSVQAGMEIDLEEDIGEAGMAAAAADDDHDAKFRQTIESLRNRRMLLRKSLTCFQVTYNIINSRFKVTEEYPTYLRSILMERLQPATEYQLRISAIYLNKYKRTSQRVHFISPTDNESRRFKENTYRPIHSYPDERRTVRIGLAQVRCEELAIVGVAVLFWIATICLFFNKWGKIRMLEPYQPAYREVSPSSAASFAAAAVVHHPALSTASAHNLHQLAAAQQSSAPGSGTNSIVGPLEGPLVGATSTVHAPLVAGPVVCPVDVCLSSDAKKRRDSATALPAGPAPNLLLLGKRRFGTISEETPRTSPFSLGRTAELNYLFQSKAAALAKASLLWPTAAAAPTTLISQQKLKQDQFRTRLNSQAALTSATTDFETIRQMGKCLAARRGFAAKHHASGPASPMVRHLYGQRHPMSQPLVAHQQKQQLLMSLQSAEEAKPATNRNNLDEALKASFESSTGSFDRNRKESTAGDLISRSLLASQQRQTEPQRRLRDETTKRSQFVAFGKTSTSATSSASQLLRFSKRNDAIDLANLSPRSSIKLATQSLDQPSYGEHTTTTTTTTTTGMSRAGQTALDAAGRLMEQSELSLQQQQQQQQDPEVMNPNRRANKLRRMQFMNKMYQHHHVATSASTSTIMAAQTVTNTQTSASLGSSMVKLNSLSSSDGNNEPDGRRTPPRCQIITSLEASISLGELGTDDESNLEAGTTSSVIDLQEQQPPARSKPRHLRLNEDAIQGRLVEHQIHIEPPSPPTSRSGSKQTTSGRPDDRETTSPDGAQFVVPTRGAEAEGPCEQTAASAVGDGDGDGDGCSAPIIRMDSQSDGQPKSPDCGGASQEEDRQRTSNWQLHQQMTARETSTMAADIGQHHQGHHERRSRSSVDAFAKLASTYQASTERRSQRLANARSFVQLGAIQCACARCLAGACYCPSVGVATCGGGGGGQSAAKLATTGSQEQQRHRSFCAGQPIEQSGGSVVVGCSADESGSGGLMLVSSTDQLQPATSDALPGPVGRRRCSFCGLPGCANKQAAAILAAAQVIEMQQQLAAGTSTPAGAPNSIETSLDPLDASLEKIDEHQRRMLALMHQQRHQQRHSSGQHLGPDEGGRPRVSSVFVAAPYNRAHRDSFAMLRALSQKKSKSAEDVAYLSSLVLQIWARDRNPLLQSVSTQQLHSGSGGGGVGSASSNSTRDRRQSGPERRPNQHQQQQPRKGPKTSLTVAQL